MAASVYRGSPHGARFGVPLLRPAALAMLVSLSAPCLAAEPALQKGAAVTVITAKKECFSDTVEVFGSVQPREEVTVRPDREGLKFTQVAVEAGDSVTAGQALGRIGPADGGEITLSAPVAGLISASSAVVGAPATALQPPFRIVKNSEFDLVADATSRDLTKLAVNQPAAIRIVGAGSVQGRVRTVPSTIDQTSQLGQIQIGITSKQRLLVNASGRARITTGQSCNVAVPLTAVLYGDGNAVVQIVKRDRVETHQVDVGLMSNGEVEIRNGLNEGDVVVAKAGALLREGDQVRPISSTNTAQN